LAVTRFRRNLGSGPSESNISAPGVVGLGGADRRVQPVLDRLGDDLDRGFLPELLGQLVAARAGLGLWRSRYRSGVRIEARRSR
jgi:hypothetical protein